MTNSPIPHMQNYPIPAEVIELNDQFMIHFDYWSRLTARAETLPTGSRAELEAWLDASHAWAKIVTAEHHFYTVYPNWRLDPYGRPYAIGAPMPLEEILNG